MAEPRAASRRLLYVVAESWPTFRQDVAVLFGRALPRLGLESDLVALHEGRPPAPPWGGGEALLRPAPAGTAGRRLGAFWHALRTMAGARRERYAALQVRDLPLVATLALAVGAWKRLPVYYWMSYPIPEGQIALARERGLSAGWMKWAYPMASGLVGRALLRHVVLRRADHVFVQSDRMREELHALGVPWQRLTPVPMGVDLEAVAALRAAKPARADGARVIGYLGSLDRPRRIERLFEMLARVREQVPQARLLIVGGTEDTVHERWLRQRAQALGVDAAIDWTGWLPTAEGWARLAAAEVALSPFPRGPLLDSASPTKVPEYLALGLPVVCNDNPDQQAVIAASGAGRCVPYTPEDFAAAVLELLALTPQQREAMADAGRRWVAGQRDYRRIARDVAAAYAALGVGDAAAEIPDGQPLGGRGSGAR